VGSDEIEGTQNLKFSHKDVFSGGLITCCENSVIEVVPIDLLHLEHIGKRFDMSVAPPFTCATLCPHSKSKTEMIVLHQLTAHFESNLRPF
jgi:hypothetical protein